MITRIAPLLVALRLFRHVNAGIAPEITTVAEGYNVIAKVPCAGCPFLYQDTSGGTNEPWTERKDANALLLNVSLPYDSAFLSINNGALLSESNSILPHIYASQVVMDFSTEDLDSVLSTNQLEASHESNLGGGFFGLSYQYSLRHLKDSSALVFQFDIFELSSDLLETPFAFKMDNPDQKILELLLLPRPLLSAGEPGSAFEIIKASLVSRSQNPPASNTHQQTMRFQEWDAHGRKGTPSHLASSVFTSFLGYISSGVWALFMFVIAVIALFVVICLFCIFGCGALFGNDNSYERAQYGKRRRTGSRDVEMGSKGRFRSPEELGLTGRSRVVGIGKSD